MTLTRDDLTRTVTAFNTFAEFESAMGRGYCPTLLPSRGRPSNRLQAKRQNRWNRAVNRLRAELTKAGYRYFDGSRVIG